ncbi:MAG: DUF4203 domain-containing protein [Clostridia bacterium]|nr:DUF4203 domain-containing protein [Clostridia bacterium]
MNFTIDSTFGIAAQTFTSLYAGVPAKILVLVIALLLCFMGYRLTRWASALYGVITGVGIGICATGLISFESSQMHSLMLTIFAMLIGGIVLGALAFRFQRLGLFLICGFLGVLVGYVPATFVAEVSPEGFWSVLLVCGVLFGITGILFVKPAYVIATSLSGIPAGIALAGLLGRQSVLIFAILGGVLAILGFAVQLYLLHRQETAEEKVSAEDILQDTDPHLPVIPNEPEGEPDDIDKISHRVAEHIGITGSFKTDPFLVSDAPETVEDSTMMIPKAEEETDSMVIPQEGPEEDLQPTEPEILTGLEEDDSQPANEKIPEQAAKFAWAEEDKIVPQESPDKPEEAVSAELPDETTEAETVEDRTMVIPKAEETPEENISNLAWMEEQKVVPEEQAENAVEEQNENTDAAPAEEENLQEEPEKLEESIPEPKKNRRWFFFKRKEKKQVEQPEPAEQPEETVEAPVQPELADIILEPKEALEAGLDTDIDCEDEPEAAEDIALALDAVIAEVQQGELQASDQSDAEQAELLDQIEVVAESAVSADAKLTEVLQEIAAAAEEDAADVDVGQADVLQELETEQLDVEDSFIMTEEIPAENFQAAEVPAKKRHSGVMSVIASIVLIAAALVFAAVGIQYVEIMLALCFAGYVQKHYRSTAFACAILCVRRAVDIVLLVMQHGSWMTIGLHVVSCIIFLVLTFTALRAFFHTRYAADKTE